MSGIEGPVVPPPEAERVTEVSSVLLVGFSGAVGAGLRQQVERGGVLRAILDHGGDDLSATIAELRPDVVLIWCEALASVIELRRLMLAHPATGVVVLVSRRSPQRDRALLAAGAVVVTMAMDGDELRMALRLLAGGVMGPPRSALGPRIAGLDLLSARETEVLELLVQRRTAAEIASALCISVATVKSHTQSIYEKLGVHSRSELALYAPKLSTAAEQGRSMPRTPGRDRLAYRRVSWAGRERDRAVVIDFCQALDPPRRLWRRP